MKHTADVLEMWGSSTDPMTPERLEAGASLLLETGKLPAGQGDTFSLWDFAVDLLIAYLKETK